MYQYVPNWVLFRTFKNKRPRADLDCSATGKKKSAVQGNSQLIISLHFFSGVTITEIVVAHVIAQMMTVFVQMVIILTLSFWAYEVPCVGNFPTAVLLVGLQGFCGMCFGKENLTLNFSYFTVHNVLRYYYLSHQTQHYVCTSGK
jgi:hypothetical protein